MTHQAGVRSLLLTLASFVPFYFHVHDSVHRLTQNQQNSGTGSQFIHGVSSRLGKALKIAGAAVQMKPVLVRKLD